MILGRYDNYIIDNFFLWNISGISAFIFFYVSFNISTAKVWWTFFCALILSFVFPQNSWKNRKHGQKRASNNICHFISPCCVISEIIISKEMLAFKRFLLENMAWVHSGTMPNRSRDQKCEKWLHSIINYLICTHNKIMKCNIPGVNMFMTMDLIYLSYISSRENVIASHKSVCGFIEQMYIKIKL